MFIHWIPEDSVPNYIFLSHFPKCSLKKKIEEGVSIFVSKVYKNEHLYGLSPPDVVQLEN